MSMSDLYQTSADLKATTQDLARVESPSAALTLTRTATLAFTTTGTTITWQTETRNQGFTWSGTTITIPTSGYYALTCSLAVTTNVTFVNLDINGVQCYSMYGQSSQYFNGTTTRYFTTGDIVKIVARAAANGTINVNTEGSSINGDSPILNIVQLTGAI